MNDQFLAFAGIDWASEAHQVCVINADGEVVSERSVKHSGDGLADLCDWLPDECQAQPARIAVAIEVPHGPVVEFLLERGFAVFSVNPKQLDRFRDRFGVAGAKDDRRDAHVLCSALSTDRHCFRRIEIDNALIIELREYSRIAEDLRAERNRLANRVRAQLWRFFPQVLEIYDDLAADWILELLSKVPTPQKARRVRRSTIEQILKSHRIRKINAEQVLELLRQSDLVVADGTPEAACAHIRVAVERLKLVNRQIRQTGAQLDRLCKQIAEDQPQRDVEILSSLPGIGRIVRATLLAEAHQALRGRDYHALRALSGVAPVTKSSGKSRVVQMRYACHRRLRNAVYHWSRVAAQCDSTCKAKYDALRARGHSHPRALRSVADRLLKVACSMLQSQTLYDPQHPRRYPSQQAA